jgi:hypothetical protein
MMTEATGMLVRPRPHIQWPRIFPCLRRPPQPVSAGAVWATAFGSGAVVERCLGRHRPSATTSVGGRALRRPYRRQTVRRRGPHARQARVGKAALRPCGLLGAPRLEGESIECAVSVLSAAQPGEPRKRHPRLVAKGTPRRRRRRTHLWKLLSISFAPYAARDRACSGSS